MVMAIKNNLLEVRLQMGYKKQKDFAEFLGIHKYQYNRYENNEVQPSLEVMYKIAKKIDRHIEDIIFIENEEP